MHNVHVNILSPRQEAALAVEKREQINAVGDMDYLQMIDMWQEKNQLDPSMKAKNVIMAPNSQVLFLTNRDAM